MPGLDAIGGLTSLDILGHISYVFLAAGQFCITHKKRAGFFLRWVGEAGWLYIGIKLSMSSIWLWGILFGGIEMYGLWKWRRGA